MPTDAEMRAAKLAEAQSGLVTLEDLLRSGMSRTTIKRRVADEMLRRIRPGVFAFAGTPSFEEQRLVEAVFGVDPRAALSHDSAAYHWGLLARKPDTPHVVVRRWRREHRTTTIVHESLDFIPRDRVLKDGVPVTTPARTVVDLGATSRWLVESALSRGLRQGVFTVEEVDAFVRRVQRRGRRGVGVIRPFLELHRAPGGPTESVLEDRFLRLLVERGQPRPEIQYEVRDRLGLICRADFAYPRQRLLIELDGREYHSDPAAFQADRSKQNRTQAAGWTTLRFTWADVTKRPDYTIDLVRRTLGVLA